LSGADRVPLGTEPGQVETLEDHAAVAQIGNRRLEVLDLERHLRRFAGRLARRAKQVKLARPDQIAQAAGALLDWL
jgi:hypothetical protein